MRHSVTICNMCGRVKGFAYFYDYGLRGRLELDICRKCYNKYIKPHLLDLKPETRVNV